MNTMMTQEAMTGPANREAVTAHSPSLGSKVYRDDGRLLGTVTEVWAVTEQGLLPRSRKLLKDYGPVTGTRHLFDTGEGFIEVMLRIAPFLAEKRFCRLADIIAIEGEYIVVQHESSTASHVANHGGRTASVAA